MQTLTSWLFFGCAGILLTGCSDPRAEEVGQVSQAASIAWKGHSWNVTAGGMAGVAQGSLANVVIDNNGYLHLKITNNGGTWTAAELFTTDRLGFGTYQWQIDGPIDRFDKQVVLGLFPYGPAAGIGGDGTNEIDIEYSFWGHAHGVNGDWTNYPASGTTVGEMSYKFSLNGGTLSTSRFIWNKTSIQDFLIDGFQPVGSTTDLIKSWTYAPNNPTVNIPQQALPLGMNLWCFEATPSDGKNVEVVIRDFQFVPEGAEPPDAGGGGTSGAGGAAGAAGASGSGGRGGAGGRGGSSAAGGAAGAGGATTGGMTTGATGTGGATTGGTAGTGGSGTGGTTGPSGSTATSGTTTGTAGTSGVTGAGGSIHPGVGRSDGGADSSGGCTCNVVRPNAGEAWRALAVASSVLLFARRRRRSSIIQSSPCA